MRKKTAKKPAKKAVKGTKKEKTCKICSGKFTQEINRKLEEKYSLSEISRDYKLSRELLRKHRDNCFQIIEDIPQNIPQVVPPSESNESQVVKRLESEAERLLWEGQAQLKDIIKMKKACLKYLQDPDNPKELFLGPQAQEIEILYRTRNPKSGKLTGEKKKIMLQGLIDIVESGGDVAGLQMTYKVADPRELLLKSIAKYETSIEKIFTMRQKLLEWGYKNKTAFEETGGLDENMSVEEEVTLITKRVSEAMARTNGDVLCRKAKLPGYRDGDVEDAEIQDVE